MAFDTICVKKTVEELRSAILDGRIDKIHQPEKDELMISVRSFSGNKNCHGQVACGSYVRGNYFCFLFSQKMSAQAMPAYTNSITQPNQCMEIE